MKRVTVPIVVVLLAVAACGGPSKTPSRTIEASRASASAAAAHFKAVAQAQVAAAKKRQLAAFHSATAKQQQLKAF